MSDHPKPKSKKKSVDYADEDSMRDFNARQRQKALKNRKSSVRPPSHKVKPLLLNKSGERSYDCKQFVRNRILSAASQASGEDDPDMMLSVYRDMQPCPLRSTLKQCKEYSTDGESQSSILVD